MHRILEALNAKEQSTQELSEALGFPIGTARATLSVLTRMGLTESIPLEKRGKPFRLTSQGKERLKELTQKAPFTP